MDDQTMPVESPSGAEKVKRLQGTDSQNELLEVKVVIPESTNERMFSFRKLWAFTGPGFLMSIAFLDPGNIDADLQSGAQANYELFWVLFWSTVLGLLIQRLAARVGTITGQHLSEICYTEYRTVPRIFLWLMIEIAIIGSDMQEVVGTATAIYLLSSGKVPLYAGVIITVFDTLTFLFLDKYGLRKLEMFFALLITIMAVTFGYEFVVAKPDAASIFEGIAIPRCTNCKTDKILLMIGIVGSCISPHNLYLHSGLVKSRDIDRTKSRNISEANFYYFIECALALAVTFVINLFVMSVFAKGLFGKTNIDVYGLCVESGNPWAYEFNTSSLEPYSPVDVNMYKGGIYLGCQFGFAALIVWAIGLLAAGQSSTMTGCYAGQFAMEGFLKLTWRRWIRVLFTRSIAVVPSFIVAYYQDVQQFTTMNDFLNALMCIQLPFAVIPVIAFTSNSRIAGEFANGICHKIIALGIFFLIFAGNAILVYKYIVDIETTWILVLIGIYFLIYIIMCIYLALHCFASLTSPDSCINKNEFMKKYILGQSMLDYYEEIDRIENRILVAEDFNDTSMPSSLDNIDEDEGEDDSLVY
ncbi:protein Malvolio-like isoform X1 [Cimex lectularius]|uniref:Malvolio n=2 Tax=Cimex lectularius TaxID=79782 RepID=A0A8I6RAN1_CIMLE|nr:protein Malvolio-like isoform X1 [Cimex lectularius]